MNKIHNLFLILSLIFVISCQGAQNVLSGKSRSDGSDEFLIEKKNPLSMPPDFNELPEPENSLKTNNGDKDQNIKKKLNLNTTKKNKSLNDNNLTDSLEDNILEKISD